jgi:hypothetical protein
MYLPLVRILRIVRMQIPYAINARALFIITSLSGDRLRMQPALPFPDDLFNLSTAGNQSSWRMLGKG